MLPGSRHDAVTVNSDGSSIKKLIDGVKVRYAMTQADERGTLTEVYDPRWGFDSSPLVYVYDVTINPGAAKGWVKHEFQDDRLFIRKGSCKVVLYDDRPDSPTNGLINEFVFTDFNRGLLLIPRLVWHGIVNVSNSEVMFMNMPTQPYNHARPDKIRLPVENDYIPYKLMERHNW